MNRLLPFLAKTVLARAAAPLPNALGGDAFFSGVRGGALFVWRGALIIPSGEVRPGGRSPEAWSVSVC